MYEENSPFIIKVTWTPKNEIQTLKYLIRKIRLGPTQKINPDDSGNIL